MTDLSALKHSFRETYGQEPIVCRAPGRVNLIGEHTDYNRGFVMPAAIDLYTWAAVALRQDGRLNLRSTETATSITLSLDEPLTPRLDWSDYVVGVFEQLSATGLRTAGADVLIHGEVPMGAGLSSSAALEVALGFAALVSCSRSVDRTKLALLCQRAENQFVGTQCGIMDQFIACHGKQGHALMLDCRTLEFALLPIPDTVRLVICNTMVKHELASGEYNQRRNECEAGVQILSEKMPWVESLRDVSLPQFFTYADELPSTLARRCRHVVSENNRVLKSVEALQSGDLSTFGRLMAQSHESLRDDYAVSCRELDVMVELANKIPGVMGSRMTGGGFGGCTINLLERSRSKSFAIDIARMYEKAIGVRPEVYVCSAADGACEAR